MHEFRDNFLVKPMFTYMREWGVSWRILIGQLHILTNLATKLSFFRGSFKLNASEIQFVAEHEKETLTA